MDPSPASGGEAPLISTAPFGLLDFPLVVTEVDGAALASLTVRSHSALPVVVKLQSSMPAAITFQHENKNLHDAEDLDDDPEDWNQLFNEVGHIDAISLPPHGESTIVVSFRPMPPGSAAADDDSSRESRGGGLRGGFADQASSRRHAVQEARATIQLIAEAEHQPPLAAPTSIGSTGTGQYTDGGADAASAAPAATDAAAVAAAPAALPLPLQAQALEVGVLARHCRSVLRVDEHELAFNACTIGATTIKDFTVWNCSEVALRFRMSVAHRGTGAVAPHERPELAFFDGDSAERLVDGSQLVLGYSHTRVRAHLSAREVGQFSMQLHVVNLADARNSELLRVHALVTTTVQEEGLRLSGDGTPEQGTLDFGNCYAHVPTRSLLTIRNTSAQALDVHFASDEPSQVHPISPTPLIYPLSPTPPAPP